jgi:hypothetical protein
MNAISRVGRRSLTAEHFEPWRGNIIDVTMVDGSHRIGLLEKVEDRYARLRAVGSLLALPDGGAIRLADTMTIERASRN